MKKSFFAALAAVVVAASVQAQSTVDSIASKYKLQPMPGAMSLEQVFPVIGSYQLENSTEGTGALTVMLDSASKGIVWVEGLPQGKIKAYLKKSPATYRIMSQKTASGKQIQEGTLHYDTTTHNLHIAIGKTYNQADPAAIFAMNTDMTADATATGDTKVKPKTPAGKSKAKVQFYTAAKIMQDNNMMMDDMQMQQSDSTQQNSDSTNQQ